jgi:hypothetical protein
VSNTDIVRPASPAQRQRYHDAAALLATPLQDGPSLQQALQAVLRGTDEGDAAARDALVLCVLPWGRVCAAFDGGRERLAPWALVLLLEDLFGPDAAQGQALVPLVKAHGHRLSLAQWVSALSKPRHLRAGALALDTLPAIAARLPSLPCPRDMHEDDAAPLLLDTLLPRWSPADAARLTALWQDDRAGWSLADAAGRARDLQQATGLENAEVLRALDEERRDVPRPTGGVAEAVLGLAQMLFGSDPLAFADRCVAAGGQVPGTVTDWTVLPGSARARQLRGMDADRQEHARRTAFYADALQRLLGELRLQDTTTEGLTASAAGVPAPGPSAALTGMAWTDAAFPDHPGSPGRLTVLGTISNVMPAPLTFGLLPGTGAAAMVPVTTLRDPSTSAAPSTDADAVTPYAPGDTSPMPELEVTLLEDTVPAWITDAPQVERERLQGLLDLQAAWNDALVQALHALPSLEAFTAARLAAAIGDAFPDSGLDPASINVTITERTWSPDIPGDLLDLPAPWPVPAEGQAPQLTRQTMSLVEFAIRNAAPNWMPAPDMTITAEGHDARGAVLSLQTHEVVTLVRRVDAGAAYEAALRQALLGAGAAPAREAWTQTTRAGLGVALQMARMNGTVFPQDFFNDAQGQDIVSRMVAHVIAYPDAATRPPLDTHQVEVLSLGIGFGTATRRPVNGIWLLQMKRPERGITEVVLLAPGVPDGREVRVYPSLRKAQADPYWRGNEGYDWLKGRMSLPDQQKLATLTDRTDPVKSQRPPSRAHFTPEKMRFEPVSGDFLGAGYAATVDALIADADFRTTSTVEMDWHAGLSFAMDQLMLLGDVASVLPVMRLLRPLRWLTGAGRTGAAAGKAGTAVKKLPFSRITRLDDGRIGVLASPTGAPDWNGLEHLQQRMRTLSLKPAGTLSPTERTELQRLTRDVAALRSAYARPYTGPITVNRDDWWGCMDAIPDLAKVDEAGRMQYVSYLLSQRTPPEVRAMLRKLKENGVGKVMPTLRSLHTRAMQLMDAGYGEATPMVKAGPSGGTPGGSPAKSGSSGSVGKHASSGSQGGSPSKKLSQPLEERGGALPPPSKYPFQEVPETKWPEFLYHYTTVDNYNAMMAQGFSHLEPSAVNPVGAVAPGPVPRIVYVTTMSPEQGRRAIADALFGKAQFHPDRGNKVARVITLDTRNLPAGTRIAHYMSQGHQEVYAIGVPGNGAITLRDANGEFSVRVVPRPGAEVVPVL